MYGGEYYTALTTLVKNRRSIQEYMDSPEIKQEVNNITEIYDDEIKKKKKEMKDAMKEMGEVAVEADEPTDEEADKEVDDEDSDMKKMNHLLIADAPCLPFKTSKEGMTEKGIQMKEKLAQFKKSAVRKVSRFISRHHCHHRFFENQLRKSSLIFLFEGS